MADDVQFNLGAHSARLDVIEEQLAKIESKLDRVVSVTDRVQGGWVALAAVGTISSAVTVAVGKLIAFFKGAQ